MTIAPDLEPCADYPGLAADMRAIPEKLYYSTAEAAKYVVITKHALRFWVAEFSLQVPKSPAGYRRYRRCDLRMLLRIRNLVYTERYTIEGARQRLKGTR